MHGQQNIKKKVFILTTNPKWSFVCWIFACSQHSRHPMPFLPTHLYSYICSGILKTANTKRKSSKFWQNFFIPLFNRHLILSLRLGCISFTIQVSFMGLPVGNSLTEFWILLTFGLFYSVPRSHLTKPTALCIKGVTYCLSWCLIIRNILFDRGHSAV